MDTESNNQGFLYNTNNRLFYVSTSVMDGEDFDQVIILANMV